MIRANSQFNLFEGEARKEAGIGLVGSNNFDFMGNGLRCIMEHAPWGREFMAEEFKTYPGMLSPKHPNAWGALTSAAIRQHIIVGTGRFDKSKSPGNNAHKYEVYVRVRQ